MSENIETRLFKMVYAWGKIGIVVDENCVAFKSLIEEIKEEAIYDYKRHGEI